MSAIPGSRRCKSAESRQDVYQDVTDRIAAALETGTVPWRRPWRASGESHRNPISGTIYRGINPFLLELTAMECGYSDPRWVTFKQAKTAGGNVRKGEKSTQVVFWKQVAIRREDEETGEETTRRVPLLRTYRVFNVDQVDGLELEPEPQPDAFEPIDRCADIVAGMPNAPRIGHGGDRAFYAPAFDAVQLPQPHLFVDAEHYYSTAFHELAHATGHASRLDRPEVTEPHRFGSEPYGREELTAEMAAAMVCGVAGISPATIGDSASYIASWLRTIREDRKLVVVAAARAQRAADWILGANVDRQEEPQRGELVAA